MNLYTKQRVVKSYSIAVAGACLVDSRFNEFQGLTKHLTVLTSENVESQSVTQDIELNLPMEEENSPHCTSLSLVQQAQAQAEAEAAEVIRRAEIQAEEIVGKAEKDAVEIKRAAEVQTRLEVEPQAHAEGYRAGYSEGKVEAGRLLEEAQAVLRLSRKALENEYSKVNEQLLQLAVRIAERIIRSSLRLNPELLIEIARSLSLLPQEKEGSILHVSPEDSIWLAEIPLESLPCPWAQDENLNIGDCFLECREGIYDARLYSQLDKLEQALWEEMKNGELEPTGTAGGQN